MRALTGAPPCPPRPLAPLTAALTGPTADPPCDTAGDPASRTPLMTPSLIVPPGLVAWRGLVVSPSLVV
ncbi:hypothetical protein [Nonomuraea rhodomycinica]|uniref:Uncharacterized protein n=1 Tax=Nonomuraea rhodomycinica TaxID=1712872 RepID=A0A7Y6IQY0_9ACTN|nr:hypothetical protein [Nonomuraea rhodomycinica]NUW42732.1 hypothetical protein [Nonomuraea rhodomycinica]